MGPLIDIQAVYHYQKALEAIKNQGGKMLVQGGVLKGRKYGSGCYVLPCIAEVTNDLPIVQSETFAPILYVMSYRTLDEEMCIRDRISTTGEYALTSRSYFEPNSLVNILNITLKID